MKKSICKKLRGIAFDKTIGQSESVTKRLYQRLKREWKINSKPKVITKLRLSKRQKRLALND